MLNLETPVFSVAIDAVCQVDGQTDLSALLTLASKCKGFVQQGPRLENLCWRLWARDRSYRYNTDDEDDRCSTRHSALDPMLFADKNDGTSNASVEDESDDDMLPAFPDDEHIHPRSHSCSSSARRSSRASSSAPHFLRRPSLSTRRTTSGKIIAELLPETIDLVHAKARTSAERSMNNGTAQLDATPVPSVSVAVEADPSPPMTPKSFPNVVIINPTPHPTPPMSPPPSENSPSPTAEKAPSLAVPTLLSRLPSSALTIDRPSSAASAAISMGKRVPSPAPEIQPRFCKAQNDESPDRDWPYSSSSSQVGGPSAIQGRSQASGSGEPGSVVSTQSEAVSQDSGGSARTRKGQGKNKEVRVGARPTMTRMRSHQRQQGTAAAVSARPKLPRVNSESATSATSSKNKAAPHAMAAIVAMNRSQSHQGHSHNAAPAAPAALHAPAPQPAAVAPARAPAPVAGPSMISPPRIQRTRTAPLANNRMSFAVALAGNRSQLSASSSDMASTENSDGDSWASEDESAEGDGQTPREDPAQKAALEAQRLRDMFAKVDRKSYTNLNRTQSSLLTTLFHPDPNRFPENHPYRYSWSSQDILARPVKSLYAPAPLTQPGVATAVAAPVTLQVQASSRSSSRPAPRLRGTPEVELESDSDEEDEENAVPMGSSLAMQRLTDIQRARRLSAEARQASAHAVLPLAPAVPIDAPVQYTTTPAVYESSPTVPAAAALGFPYNLPPPVPVSTPRTTRRNFLQRELPESLRMNMLWERQVSKQGPMGVLPRERRSIGMGIGRLPPPPPMIEPEEPKGDFEERKRRVFARNRSFMEDQRPW